MLCQSWHLKVAVLGIPTPPRNGDIEGRHECSQDGEPCVGPEFLGTSTLAVSREGGAAGSVYDTPLNGVGSPSRPRPAQPNWGIPWATGSKGRRLEGGLVLSHCNALTVTMPGK
jgi:hypothetical protein